ncbi:hypothetical protein NQZ68_013452 [Dissostichus eleginoides]|nr:hypothetical protein NQZ68_013452 [Dissostichus eleginoides]
MSLTAAASGLVVFLLSVSVVQGQDGWGVTYSSTEICAVKGSTVEIRCSYKYPSTWKGLVNTVQKTFWFTKWKDGERVDLTTDSEYAGRVEDLCENNICTLRIRNLRESDSVEYRFKFETNQGGKYGGSTGVTLSVSSVRGQTCNRVIYTERSICAFKGSSVDISCTYSSFEDDVKSKFWFSPERSHQGQNPSQPEDLSEDSQYAGRVQILETERGRSTLRISDLRDSDSAQYLFKFKTPSFEWRSDLPGTSLTVTALQVQVIRAKVYNYSTEAELKCHSSCSPAGSLNYVWFKNGEKITTTRTSSYKGLFQPRDNISCALEGHEDFPSPPVYAPKPPSVSVSPSAEIEEGSSVTLTCSSDANPAANYTWYKENEDSPKASGQIFNITDFRAEHSGSYSCGAQNKLGRSNSTLTLIVVAGSSRMIVNIIRTTLGVLILIPVFLLSLWMRKKKALRSTTEAHEPEEIELDSDPVYQNDSDTAAQTEDTEEQEDMV